MDVEAMMQTKAQALPVAGVGSIHLLCLADTADSATMTSPCDPCDHESLHCEAMLLKCVLGLMDTGNQKDQKV